MYAVVLAAGGLSAFQAWQAQRSEDLRAREAEVANLAGAQRMLSQRIGRLAAFVGAGSGDRNLERLELQEALERAAREGSRIEQLLLAQDGLCGDAAGALEAASASWRSTQERLRSRGHELIRDLAGGDATSIGRSVTAVQTHADPALLAAQRMVDELGRCAQQRHLGVVDTVMIWAIVNLLLLTALVIVVAEPTVRSLKRQCIRLTQQAGELRIAAIAMNSLDAIVITDARQIILKINAAFTRITGYAEEEAVGRVPGRLLSSGRHDNAFYAGMWTALERDRHWQGEIWNRRRNGEIYPQWLSITAVTDDADVLTNYVAVFADITQKKQADETIHRLAFFDPLTELPNRRLLRDRLMQTLVASARHRRSAAVLFMDIDHFKELNDTKGHDLGDLLLVAVAKRLTACVRAGDTVARQGGDEFVIVLVDLSEDPTNAAVQVEQVAERIRRAVGRPFDLGGYEHRCTASIGVSMLDGTESSVEGQLRRADAAMYDAKKSGRNSVRFFDRSTQEAMEARMSLEADLRRALPDDRLRLHYQPQVDQHGGILGAEVLIRWDHPTRGLVSPSEFIPLAEETDLIVEIGQWVLEAACRQLAAWDQVAAMRHLQLSVNVSAKQFRQADFVEQVCDALAGSGADPSRLKLELTESLVLVNMDDAVAKMRSIRCLGVRFSMDDFGTGHSCLAYLAQLPIDQLKIDRSFVQTAVSTRTGAVLVQTIIGMAHSLGLEVIAEGVETAEQCAFLERNGCTFYQGYLFGRPTGLNDFEARVCASGQAKRAGGAQSRLESRSPKAVCTSDWSAA